MLWKLQVDLAAALVHLPAVPAPANLPDRCTSASKDQTVVSRRVWPPDGRAPEGYCALPCTSKSAVYLRHDSLAETRACHMQCAFGLRLKNASCAELFEQDCLSFTGSTLRFLFSRGMQVEMATNLCLAPRHLHVNPNKSVHESCRGVPSSNRKHFAPVAACPRFRFETTCN
eukprot:1657148-Rhodomonas_salina.1